MSSAYNPADDLDGIKHALFAHFEQEEQSGLHAQKTPENGFPFPPQAQPPTLWVKFNPDANLMVKEYEMHCYVQKHCLFPTGHRMPRAHRVYSLPDRTKGLWGPGFDPRELPWGLLIMDYIQGTRLCDIQIHEQDPLFQSIVASRVATLLVTMSLLKPPHGTIAPGPGDGFRMCHLIWGVTDFEAPQAFDTVEGLQDYINNKIKDVNPEAAADFSREPLCLCYGDFNEGNFLLENHKDPHSALTIIDFGQTNWLPISFLHWEMVNRDYRNGPFYRQVAEAVRGTMRKTPNMENLQALNSLRWVCGQEETS